MDYNKHFAETTDVCNEILMKVNRFFGNFKIDKILK